MVLFIKRIKTRLRTTVVEERLSDLLILSIEKEISQSIEEEEVVHEFASSDKNRHILLI